MKEKIFNLKNQFLFFVFMTSISFAKTTGESAAGFEKVITYFAAFKNMVVYVLYLVAVVYLIFKIVEFMGNFQWQEFAKAVLGFVIIVGMGMSIDLVVKAVGGTIINSEVKEIVKQIKIDENKIIK